MEKKKKKERKGNEIWGISFTKEEKRILIKPITNMKIHLKKTDC